MVLPPSIFGLFSMLLFWEYSNLSTCMNLPASRLLLGALHQIQTCQNAWNKKYLRKNPPDALLIMMIEFRIGIPHIYHFFYTGRIFESQIFTPKNYAKHPKITTNTPKKCTTCSSSRSIWKILHRTEFFYTCNARGARDKYEVWYLGAWKAWRTKSLLGSSGRRLLTC